MADPASCAPVRFSTAGLPELDRVMIWREHYARMALRLDIEPFSDASFDCALVTRELPGVQLLDAVMSAVRITRTREFAADGNDDLALIINQKGAFMGSARGREVTLGEGDALLISSDDVGLFERQCRGGSFSLRVPRSYLSSMVVDVDDAVMHLIPRHTEALRLLTGYAKPLIGDLALDTPHLRRTVAGHLHDLVALTLGATRDAADAAKGRGVRAARLKLAKAYVADNSGRRDLSVSAVAAQLGVTPRYIQRLFEDEGRTFSSFLLERRLFRARRMLTEPRFAQRAVSAIAYDVGFNDLSYFNRCFKQQYGATPRDIRNGAAE